MINFATLKEDLEKMRERKAREAEEDKQKFYLIVAGSRTFSPYGTIEVSEGESVAYIENNVFIENSIKQILKSRIEQGLEIILVCGDAKGVDASVKIIAERNSWALMEFKADWDSNKRSAGMIRNKTMYRFVSEKPNKGSLLIWDGTSPGTENNFLQAYDFDVPVRCYNFMRHCWLSKDEVYDIQEKVVTDRKWYNK